MFTFFHKVLMSLAPIYERALIQEVWVFWLWMPCLPTEPTVAYTAFSRGSSILRYLIDVTKQLINDNLLMNNSPQCSWVCLASRYSVLTSVSYVI